MFAFSTPKWVKEVRFSTWLMLIAVSWWLSCFAFDAWVLLSVTYWPDEIDMNVQNRLRYTALTTEGLSCLAVLMAILCAFGAGSIYGREYQREEHEAERQLLREREKYEKELQQEAVEMLDRGTSTTPPPYDNGLQSAFPDGFFTPENGFTDDVSLRGGFTHPPEPARTAFDRAVELFLSTDRSPSTAFHLSMQTEFLPYFMLPCICGCDMFDSHAASGIPITHYYEEETGVVWGGHDHYDFMVAGEWATFEQVLEELGWRRAIDMNNAW